MKKVGVFESLPQASDYLDRLDIIIVVYSKCQLYMIFQKKRDIELVSRNLNIIPGLCKVNDGHLVTLNYNAVEDEILEQIRKSFGEIQLSEVSDVHSLARVGHVQNTVDA